MAGLYLGSEAFIERIKALTIERSSSFRAEHSKLQENVRVVELETVLQAVEAHFQTDLQPKTWRNELARWAFALLARRQAVATLAAIGNQLDLSPSATSRLIARSEALRASSKEFEQLLRELQLSITHAKRKG